MKVSDVPSPRKKRGTPPGRRRAPPAAGVVNVGIATAALGRDDAPLVAHTALHPGDEAAPPPIGLSVRTRAGPAGRCVGTSPGRPAGRVRRGRVGLLRQAGDAIAGDGQRRGRVGECNFLLVVAGVAGKVFGSSGISPRLVRTEGRRGHVGIVVRRISVRIATAASRRLASHDGTGGNFLSRRDSRRGGRSGCSYRVGVCDLRLTIIMTRIFAWLLCVTPVVEDMTGRWILWRRLRLAVVVHDEIL